MVFKFDRNKMSYLTDPDDYESSWEWTKARSSYHFDNNILFVAK